MLTLEEIRAHFRRHDPVSGRVGPLRGEARVLRSGKLLSTYEVRVTDAEGSLVAVATITGYGVGARLPLGDA